MIMGGREDEDEATHEDKERMRMKLPQDLGLSF